MIFPFLLLRYPADWSELIQTVAYFSFCNSSYAVVQIFKD